MKKKIFAAFLVVIGLALAFQMQGAPLAYAYDVVPSIAAKTAPEIKPLDSGDVAQIVKPDGTRESVALADMIITAYQDATGEILVKLDAAKEQIENLDDHSQLKNTLNEAANAIKSGATSDNLTATYLFDLALRADLEEMLNGSPDTYIRVTFVFGGSAEDPAPIIAYKNTVTGNWDTVAKKDITVNSDGSVTAIFYHLCPIVFFAADTSAVQPVGCQSIEIILLIIIIVLLIILILLTLFKRNRDDEEQANEVATEEPADAAESEAASEETEEPAEEPAAEESDAEEEADEAADMEEESDEAGEEGAAEEMAELGFAAMAKKPVKPFEERMREAADEVKARYSELKNGLLQYKKVKARTSKKAESFRYGRDLLAKILIVGKTLRIYLALDPNEFDTNKFHQKDASEKRAYVEVPLQMNVRSDRAVKHALELVSTMMERKELPKNAKYEAQDYSHDFDEQA